LTANAADYLFEKYMPCKTLELFFGNAQYELYISFAYKSSTNMNGMGVTINGRRKAINLQAVHSS